MNKYTAILFFFIGFLAFSQQTARVKGIIFNENNQPVSGVSVAFLDKAAVSNENGFYILTIPANTKGRLLFSHISYKSQSVIFELKSNEDYEYNPILKTGVEEIGEVLIDG